MSEQHVPDRWKVGGHDFVTSDKVIARARVPTLEDNAKARNPDLARRLRSPAFGRQPGGTRGLRYGTLGTLFQDL